MTDTLSALSNRIRSKDSLDVSLLWGLIALGITGVIMIYSATRQALISGGYNPHYYLERQALYVILGIGVMYGISLIDYRRLEIVATPLYVSGLLGLFGVMFLGSTALGAQRWFNLGLFQVQPSEFTVLFLIVAVGTYCARRPEGLKLRDVWRLLAMAGAPLVMIVLQPDLGTSIIILISIGAMLVVAGVPPRFMTALAVIGSFGMLFAAYFSILQKYQIERFTSFLNQNTSSADAQLQALIYQVNNAKSAIGSGGLHGAGFFNGLQTVLGYVPEQRTDFIFTAIGEQLGFIGSLLIISLLAFVAYRMFRIGRNAKDTMGRTIVLGIFVFFSFSCFENIGMTMGIMPMTGIPLPLLSYGGSAAMVFFAAGGVVLSVSRRSGS